MGGCLGGQLALRVNLAWRFKWRCRNVQDLQLLASQQPAPNFLRKRKRPLNFWRHTPLHTWRPPCRVVLHKAAAHNTQCSSLVYDAIPDAANQGHAHRPHISIKQEGGTAGQGFKDTSSARAGVWGASPRSRIPPSANHREHPD